MIGELVVMAGPDKGRRFPLLEGQAASLGRGTDANLQIADPRASRVHCRFSVEDGKLQMHDAGSKAGTFVNGKQVAQKQILPGDVIRVGDSEIHFQLTGAGAETITGVGPGGGQAKPAAAGSSDQLAGLVGQKISHYQLQKVLARGSNGIVFFAKDTEHNRDVALKILLPEFSSDDEQMQRFVRAMKTMMPLHHPNLVRLYGAGKTGAHCWIAMEYIDGESLRQVIERIGAAGMLDWTIAFRACFDVALGLQEAHEHSILHRNITPTNILIRKKDKSCVLGDLMLAKALEGTLAEQLTRPGQLLGEMAYMSPERTKSVGDVDTRSDIYSLGATIYAVLTGRPPFEGSSLPDLITKIRNAEPAKPKKFQLSIPDIFEGVILRMLAKRPEDRYETASDLLKDLERIAKFNNIPI